MEESLVGATLDDLARVGARRMIATALPIEVDDDLAGFRGERDAAGHALVMRRFPTERPGGHPRGDSRFLRSSR